jgi:hypothetical protein
MVSATNPMERLRVEYGIIRGRIRDAMCRLVELRRERQLVGIVASINPDPDNPAVIHLTYHTGRNRARNGREVPIYETAIVPTPQVLDKEIQVGDLIWVSPDKVRVDQIASKDHILSNWLEE